MLRRTVPFLLPMAIVTTPTIAAESKTALDAAPVPIVIAHRGASAYLPEHTLAAKAMAHAMGADYLEQDLVLTRDGEAIVLHDLYLEDVTDVERRFPDRARADGRWYAIDFSLADIRSLRLREEIGTRIPLIQLIGENDWRSPADPPVDFDQMRTPEGLAAVAEYARGIGPWIGQIHQGLDDTGGHRTTALVADAHAAGLLVHPYTLRRDELPEGFEDFAALLRFFLVDQGVDGVFTDHPDLAVHKDTMASLTRITSPTTRNATRKVQRPL